MRIIFLNRFYWPDEPATAQLLTDLAEGLAARGHEVTVIAGRFGGVPKEEIRGGVRILRAWSTQWGRHSLVGRAVDFATFIKAACWRLALAARKGDIVVAMTDPPLLGACVWPVARIRGTRLVQWVQDIFPEVATALSPGPVGSIAGALLRPPRNFAWRHSRRCVLAGTDMTKHAAGAGVPADRIDVIPNWAPAGLEPLPPAAADGLRREWNLEGRFVVAYAGNLGRVHDLDPVLGIAAALRDESRIVFVFIGAGAQRSSLQAAAKNRSLSNVQFREPQPRARLGATLALGDVHLVTLRPGCEGLVFPSKLYGIAAVGRPILFMGPRGCDVAEVVSAKGLGLAFTRDEIAGAAEALRRLARDPGRCAAIGRAAAEFSKAEGRASQALAAWDALLIREAAC